MYLSILYVYISIYIHTYIYVYQCVCVCVYNISDGGGSREGVTRLLKYTCQYIDQYTCVCVCVCVYRMDAVVEKEQPTPKIYTSTHTHTHTHTHIYGVGTGLYVVPYHLHGVCAGLSSHYLCRSTLRVRYVKTASLSFEILTSIQGEPVYRTIE
jgi:hypothetical protein